ncbi:MAG: signal peptidase I [Spirochaetales bacterium]|nr:signal peptidase I [Spirochaetales bacterium]
MSKRSKLLGSYSSFKPQNKFKTKISKTIKTVIIFFLVYQFISIFIISPFIVKTSAMEPGILKGQRILTAPIISGTSLNLFNIRIPGLKEPERGDIILVRPGNSNKSAWYIILLDTVVRFITLQKISLDPNIGQNWNNQLAVKRIIGIPGDTLLMVDYKFLIKPKKDTEYISEENLIKQKYILKIPENISGIESTYPFSGSMNEISLIENQFLVANDNRRVLYDSRLYGPIYRNDILGPVFVSYWPGFSFK